jgi:hypothetical protein
MEFSCDCFCLEVLQFAFLTVVQLQSPAWPVQGFMADFGEGLLKFSVLSHIFNLLLVPLFCFCRLSRSVCPFITFLFLRLSHIFNEYY